MTCQKSSFCWETSSKVCRMILSGCAKFFHREGTSCAFGAESAWLESGKEKSEEALWEDSRMVERAAMRRAPRRGEAKAGLRELGPMEDAGEPPEGIGSELRFFAPLMDMGGVI